MQGFIQKGRGARIFPPPQTSFQRAPKMISERQNPSQAPLECRTPITLPQSWSISTP